MEEIRINVPLDHTKPVTVSVSGVKGQGCQALTTGIERALGKVVSDNPTEEMYEQPMEVNHHLKQHE